MTGSTQQTARGSAGAWALARAQHGVVTRKQLLALGLTRHGIEHRRARGRLHLVTRGIYAVGRPGLTLNGRRMAAVLACGGDLDARGGIRLRGGSHEPPPVVLSYDSAAALFAIGPEPVSHFEISTTLPTERRVPGVKLHRRPALARGSVGYCQGIPATSPVQTLIDLATRHGRPTMERATNEADKLGLVRTDDLRTALDEHAGEPGAARLRLILDRRTFRYTRTELERAFIPLARQAGLPLPRTSVYVTGYEVDFHFPDLGLVVETDGLTYHRTPAQQAKDRERDQEHSAAGLTPLRFTHAQIKFEPDHVVRILRATASWLRDRPASSPADGPERRAHPLLPD
jgi:very-short-patch-repair endonuclease